MTFSTPYVSPVMSRHSGSGGPDTISPYRVLSLPRRFLQREDFP